MSSTKRKLLTFKQYSPLLKELVLRDLKITYRRSFLGYLWSLLNPLLMMMVQVIVFNKLFKSTIDNFPLYVICGNALFSFFSVASSDAMHSIIWNGSLIRKVYIPKYIFPISRVMSAFVTLLFNLAAIVLVMIFTREPLYWTQLLFILPLLLLFVFTCGMSLFLAALNVYFRDIEHIYGVLIMAWTYATCLFYPADIIPPEWHFVITFNPMYHIINIFRCMIMWQQPGPINTWIAALLSSALMLGVGLYTFRKAQKNFILHI
jgi:ABC-2 type transport system permease protein